MIDLYKRNTACIHIIIVSTLRVIIAAVYNFLFMHVIFSKIPTDSVQLSILARDDIKGRRSADHDIVIRKYFLYKGIHAPALAAIREQGKKPDVVFSKGGFVAVPVVFGAWLHRIPVLCHESDLTPGLANKLCKPFAKRFATTFPECAEALGSKAEMTGTPLRPELFAGTREKGLAVLGFDGTKPVLLMMGGSSGAQSINACLRKSLPELTKDFDVAHICGKGNLDPSLEGTAGYRQIEFLDAGTRNCRTCWPVRIWC